MILLGDLLFTPTIFLLPSPLKPHFLHAPPQILPAPPPPPQKRKKVLITMTGPMQTETNVNVFKD